MARDNENKCLNSIINGFFYNRDAKLVFDNSEHAKMSSYLKTAHSNDDNSVFPDFLFDGGVIEHFEVSSSKENKKGSYYRIEQVENGRKNEEHFSKADKEYLETPIQTKTMTIDTQSWVFDKSDYESFTKSFKKNAEKHLSSLLKSRYKNQVSIFLIEQNAGRLFVCVDERFDRFYKLSEDRKMLQYIKDKLSEVGYFIYKAVDSFEIIDISKIDDVIQTAQDNLDVRGGRIIGSNLKLYIDW